MGPGGVGLGEGIGFADEGGGTVGLGAVIGGPEGFVADAAFHVGVVPARTGAGEEVEFVPGAAVLVGC